MEKNVSPDLDEKLKTWEHTHSQNKSRGHSA